MREYIYIKEHSLSDELCNNIIEYFDTHPDKQYVGCVSSNTGTNKSQTDTVNTRKKDCIDLNNCIKKTLPNSDWFPIQKTLIETVIKSLNEYFNIIDPDNNIYYYQDKFLTNCYLETFLIHKYLKNTGKFTYHNDFRYDARHKKYRLFNYMWYLNDVDEGGETEFFGDYKIKPEKGKMVIFPSEWFFPHTGKMPISNDKFVLTGWIYITI